MLQVLHHIQMPQSGKQGFAGGLDLNDAQQSIMLKDDVTLITLSNKSINV